MRPCQRSQRQPKSLSVDRPTIALDQCAGTGTGQASAVRGPCGGHAAECRKQSAHATSTVAAAPIRPKTTTRPAMPPAVLTPHPRTPGKPPDPLTRTRTSRTAHAAAAQREPLYPRAREGQRQAGHTRACSRQMRPRMAQEAARRHSESAASSDSRFASLCRGCGNRHTTCNEAGSRPPGRFLCSGNHCEDRCIRGSCSLRPTIGFHGIVAASPATPQARHSATASPKDAETRWRERHSGQTPRCPTPPAPSHPRRWRRRAARGRCKAGTWLRGSPPDQNTESALPGSTRPPPLPNH
jgi:hypothetical protein